MSQGHVAVLLNGLHQVLKMPPVLGDWLAENKKGGKALGAGARDWLLSSVG